MPCYSCQHSPLLCTATREDFQLQRLHDLQEGWHRERGSSRGEGRKESTEIGWAWETAGKDWQHHICRDEHHIDHGA